MRRSRRLTLLGGVLLAALLLPASAVGATGPSAPTGAPTAAVPTIRLGCALVIPIGHPAQVRVVCHWSALTGADVKVYRLWRVVDAPLGRPRQLIAAVAPTDPLRHTDPNVSAGHRYSYQVVAIGADGMRLGVSNVVSVRIGRPAQALALKCVYVIDGLKQGVLCHWSASTRPAAVRYVLFRSVDGAARQAVYRVGIHGRRSFFDMDVKAGQVIRYRVLAVASDGRVVGSGGPERIVVPTVIFP
jgi:hypothetical protein